MSLEQHSARAPIESPSGRRASDPSSASDWRYAKVLFLLVLAACGAGKEDDETPSNGAPPAPAPSTVPAPCTTAPALFSASVWPSLNTSCTGCHVQGGIAGGTHLVFAPTASEIANYNILRDFAKTSGDLLLSKTIGMPSHGGGAPYMNASSQAYKNLQQLIPQMTAQVCTVTVTPPPTASGGFWQDVAFAADSSVLAKAAVLFAGRNPSIDEAAAVASGGQTALRQAIRGYMQGPVFERWLDDVGDTHFLSPGVPVRGDTGYNATDWPSAGAVLDAANVTQADNATRNRFDAAARREGIELMKYIVRNDRPYTDIVTANYTVVNGILAQYLGATVQGSFTDATNDAEWRQATLPSQRLGGMREHAGVLSTHPWLSRFPTTATNRNRHRVNVMFKQFLGTDVTMMAVRPLDDGTREVPRAHRREPGVRGVPRHGRPDRRGLPELEREQPLPAVPHQRGRRSRAAVVVSVGQLSEGRQQPGLLPQRRQLVPRREGARLRQHADARWRHRQQDRAAVSGPAGGGRPALRARRRALLVPGPARPRSR